MEFVSGNSIDSAATGLLNLLGGIIEALANFFGVTVEFVKDNFWEYIMMFGRYRLGTKIVTCAIAVTIIATILVAIISAIKLAIKHHIAEYDEDYRKSCESVVKTLSSVTKIIIAVFLIVFVCYSGYHIVRYAISPELYAIDVTVQYISCTFGGN